MKTVALTLLILFVTHFTVAANFLSEQAISDRLDSLENDFTMLPTPMLEQLEDLSKISKENNWQKSYIKANVLKAELFTYLEQLQKANKIVEDFLPLSEQLGYHKLHTRLKIIKLGLYDTQGFSPEVEQLIDELLIIVDEFDDPMEKASIYGALGQSYYMHQHLDSSLKYLKLAYTIYSDSDDKSNKSYILNSLANLYTDLEDYATAIIYLNQSLVINEELGDRLTVSIILYNLGKTHTLAGNHEQALEALNQSIDIGEELNDEVGVIWAKQSIADVYLRINQPEYALPHYLEAAPIFRESGDLREYYHSLHGLFDSYFQLGQYHESERLIPQINTVLEQLNSDEYRAFIYIRTAKLHAAQRNYERAYNDLNLYVKQKDKLINKEKEQNIQKLKISFESEKKEQQNKLLQKENQLQQFKLEQKQNEQTMLFIITSMAFTLIVVIAILLYRQMRSRNIYRTLALKDSLTQSPNRRAILKSAKLQYQRALTDQSSFSLAIVDLDKFKLVNDIYGHDTGDRVLIAFANTCNEILRKADSFGRYGGEEWLFVFNENDANVIKIFQRIRLHLNNQNIAGYPENKLITFSVGIARFKPKENQNLQQLINQADEYLYQAKLAGRDRAILNGTEQTLS